MGYKGALVKDNERSLVRRIQSGDQTAFREMVDEHKKNVYYLALDLSGNHFDAEDISQEVFVKAYRGIGNFRSGAKLGTWLYRITKNTFIDRTRKKSLKVVSLSSHSEDSDDPDPLDFVADETTGNPERALNSTNIDKNINEALQVLSEQERTVFVMRHYHDLQIKEIAESLEIAEGTVKSLLFRSVRKLRDKLSYYRNELGLEDSL